jgi:hypothetical protein
LHERRVLRRPEGADASIKKVSVSRNVYEGLV